MRRIWTRGLRGANKFMIGAAIAYNLKKWLNYSEQKRKTAVMKMKKAGEWLCFLILIVSHFINGHTNKPSKYLTSRSI